MNNKAKKQNTSKQNEKTTLVILAVTVILSATIAITVTGSSLFMGYVSPDGSDKADGGDTNGTAADPDTSTGGPVGDRNDIGYVIDDRGTQDGGESSDNTGSDPQDIGGGQDSTTSKDSDPVDGTSAPDNTSKPDDTASSNDGTDTTGGDGDIGGGPITKDPDPIDTTVPGSSSGPHNTTTPSDNNNIGSTPTIKDPYPRDDQGRIVNLPTVIDDTNYPVVDVAKPLPVPVTRVTFIPDTTPDASKDTTDTVVPVPVTPEPSDVPYVDDIDYVDHEGIDGVDTGLYGSAPVITGPAGTTLSYPREDSCRDDTEDPYWWVLILSSTATFASGAWMILYHALHFIGFLLRFLS